MNLRSASRSTSQRMIQRLWDGSLTKYMMVRLTAGVAIDWEGQMRVSCDDYTYIARDSTSERIYHIQFRISFYILENIRIYYLRFPLRDALPRRRLGESWNLCGDHASTIPIRTCIAHHKA